MCNQYRVRLSLDKLAEDFGRLQLPLTWAGGAPNLEPRDPVRPTDPAPVLVGRDGAAELKQLRWGFPGPRGPVINFRSEGRRFPQGRCLVPADGFYEFTGDKAPKAKWLFTAADEELFCIAGLIRDDRFTLLTMEPGPDVAPYHKRQIVILPRRDWRAWLGAEGEAQPALISTPAGSLRVERLR